MKILSRVKEKILRINKEKFKENFSDWDRKIQINLGKEKFYILICGGKISAKDGALARADIKIESDAGTIENILKEKISPMDAYAQGKLFIAGAPDDLGMLIELVKRLGR